MTKNDKKDSQTKTVKTPNVLPIRPFNPKYYRDKETIVVESEEIQMDFFYNTFGPLLKEIGKTYPIESLRLKFIKVINKYILGQDHHEICQSTLPGEYVEGVGYRSAFAAAAWDKKLNRNCMIFYIPNVMHILRWYGMETLKDQIIEATLHENFHIENKHHLGGISRQEAESQTWWYECQEVVTPMLAAGRFKNLEKGNELLITNEVYKQADGNPNAKVWQDYIAANVAADD